MSTHKQLIERAWKMTWELRDSAGVPVDGTISRRISAVIYRQLYLHDEAQRKRTTPKGLKFHSLT